MAEAAALQHLSSIGWKREGFGVRRTANAERCAEGGWCVFVDDSGLLQDVIGSHCTIYLDDDFEVTWIFPGA